MVDKLDITHVIRKDDKQILYGALTVGAKAVNWCMDFPIDKMSLHRLIAKLYREINRGNGV